MRYEMAANRIEGRTHEECDDACPPEHSKEPASRWGEDKKRSSANSFCQRQHYLYSLLVPISLLDW